MSYSPWGCKELDTTERLRTHTWSRIASIYFNISDVHIVYIRAGVLFSIQEDEKGMEYSWTVGDFQIS